MTTAKLKKQQQFQNNDNKKLDEIRFTNMEHLINTKEGVNKVELGIINLCIIILYYILYIVNYVFIFIRKNIVQLYLFLCCVWLCIWYA